MEELADNFNSDEEDNILHVDPLSIKKEDFEFTKIINYLQELGLLKIIFICLICSKKMKIEHNIQYIDKHVWRCQSSNPLHDIKKI